MLLILCVLAWARGAYVRKTWLVLFPIIALVFDLVAGLNLVQFVPTIMHLCAIIVGVSSQKPSPKFRRRLLRIERSRLIRRSLAANAVRWPRISIAIVRLTHSFRAACQDRSSRYAPPATVRATRLLCAPHGEISVGEWVVDQRHSLTG